ncbi:MAG TPA: Fic family protein [Gaiella sp.]|nr:Fic family protein [Gaiella sp.]
MLYPTPALTRALERRLRELDALRRDLRARMGEPGPWLGTLRRIARASAAASSTAIEGFGVAEEDAVAIVSGDATPRPDEEDRLAVACYVRAMDHVGVMADDPSFRWLDRVILDLHFDTCSFQRAASPGRWRTGPIGVTGDGDRLIYEAPDADRVPQLMAEVVNWLQLRDLGSHAVVRAAMAHLHVVSVHPFRDGNGRVARIVQSLVLAREGLLAPELSSIEDYLATHTAEYYDVLQRVQGGRYQPERDATAWVRFCLDAHVEQARRRVEQVERAASRWSRLERLVEDRGWPDRLVIALEQSLVGGTERARYGAEAGVSPASATNDLRRLSDAGLIVPRGRGRSTRYDASDRLRAEGGDGSNVVGPSA